MYAQLKMELRGENLSYRKASNLQGVIMENIDSDYACQLHSNHLNPYSQCLICENASFYWYIRTMNQEAYEKILIPLSILSSFRIKRAEKDIEIGERSVSICQENDLLEEFYQKKGSHFFSIAFQTPTAFKHNGQYINYPDLRLFYGSLMRKYSAASEGMEMTDEDTLEQLVSASKISRYNLRTVIFPLENTRITGFCGNISIYIQGTDTMARFARLLCRFGIYSGVGIKTAMGMGAISCREGGFKSD